MAVFSIFNAKKNKEKKLIPTIGEYYAGLARKTGYLMLGILFVFLGFIFFCFTFYSNQLTIENLRYMLKFADFQASPIAPNKTEIIFDSELRAKTEIIRGDIAIADINGLKLYDFNGKRLFSVNYYYNDPHIVCNGKNIIISENNSYELKIYSSYSEVYTQTFSHQIYGIKSNSSGKYLVQTASQGFRSSIELYDEYFRMIFNQKFGDEYISNTALSNDGTKVAAATFESTETGNFKSNLHIYDAETANEINLFTYNDELPWAVGFTASNGIISMTSGGLRFYNADGELLNEKKFQNRIPLSFHFSDKYAIIVYKNSGLGTSVTLEVYNASGTIITSRVMQNEISYMKIIDNHAYIYSFGNIHTIDLIGQAQDKADYFGDGLIDILYDYENDQIWIINQNGAIIYDRNYFNKGE